MGLRPPPELDHNILQALETRLGPLSARRRLAIERDHEVQLLGRGHAILPLQLTSYPGLIRAVLKVTGLYWRGLRNAKKVRLVVNEIASKKLPSLFDGFCILHLSDLHVDMNKDAMHRVISLLERLSYDICVLTGDYRGQNFGPFEATLAGMARIRAALKEPVYGVLGDHDTISMVPGLEEMGIRMLLNEHEAIARDQQYIYLAGIDDAHLYHADNIEQAVPNLSERDFSILLSHTPEIYRKAAQAGFSVLLAGHTHGGQICLPGQIPIITDSILPRYMAARTWTYQNMTGYTSVGAGSSVVPVRFNCSPEITMHYLRTTA